MQHAVDVVHVYSHFGLFVPGYDNILSSFIEMAEIYLEVCKYTVFMSITKIVIVILIEALDPIFYDSTHPIHLNVNLLETQIRTLNYTGDHTPQSGIIIPCISSDTRHIE
jgi:hypothetical protein